MHSAWRGRRSGPGTGPASLELPPSEQWLRFLLSLNALNHFPRFTFHRAVSRATIHRPHAEWSAGRRPSSGTQKRPALTTLYFLFQPLFSRLPVVFGFVFPFLSLPSLLVLYFSSCPSVFGTKRSGLPLPVTVKEALHPLGIYFSHAQKKQEVGPQFRMMKSGRIS